MDGDCSFKVLREAGAEAAEAEAQEAGQEAQEAQEVQEAQEAEQEAQEVQEVAPQEAGAAQYSPSSLELHQLEAGLQQPREIQYMIMV